MIKKIAILGSTGSIGESTLKIVKTTQKFNVELIYANKNFSKIDYQIKFFKPKIVIINNTNIYKKIKKKYEFKKKLIILNNTINLDKYIKTIDITISAIPGIAGLEPTLLFIKLSKKVLLANKEAIVCGWELIKAFATKHNTELIPIDSEHFSIGRLIKNYSEKNIKKIYITASGGPFLNLNIKKFRNIKPKHAVKHPKWKMGKKISVDSATLMNKVLEITEALKLFPFDLSKYEIIVHPQSLVHAIVELEDGTTIFLYHTPDMKVPIGNAMLEDFNYFKYFKPNVKQQNTINSLHFSPVDTKKFPVVKLIPKINARKSSPIIINAANEIFVDQFLKNNISFNDISSYLNLVLKSKNYIKTSNMSCNSIKNIYKIDTWARSLAFQIIKKKTKLF